MNVYQVSQEQNVLGESPVWSREERALYWVDIDRKQLLRMAIDSGSTNSWTLPEFVCAVALRSDPDSVLLALERRLVIFDLRTGGMSPVCTLDADASVNRANDGRCDAAGRFWLGTMQNNLEGDESIRPVTMKSGVLYRIEGNGKAQAVCTEIGISNGIAWSPDNRTMYFADSVLNRIDAFDYDLGRGEVSNRRVFAPPFDRGSPDGSAVDVEGHLWNARFGGGCLIRYRPDGSTDCVVDLPVSNPTSCVFGGPDMTTLYVTSATIGLSGEQIRKNPLEGTVLAVDVGVPGCPCHRFAG